MSEASPEHPRILAARRQSVTAELEARLPDWDAEEDDVLVCRAVRQETHDVKTFVFSGRSPRRHSYKPGQFITLDLTINGQAINRCYTISSSPTRPHLISITTKRFAGGVVSPWLHDTMKPGVEIRAIGPMGEFNCIDHASANGKYLLLSAGSGVTPMMSMARSFHDLAMDTDVLFLHSARSPADIIYRQELAMMARSPGFRAVPICEHDNAEESWTGLRGRITLPMLQMVAPDLMEREVFACGPAPYMAGIRSMLSGAGFDMTRYHEESFKFEDLAPADAALAPPANTDVAVKTYKVEFTKSRRTIEVGADTHVLAAARAAGMRLPSSCARGFAAPARANSSRAKSPCSTRAASASGRSTRAWC